MKLSRVHVAVTAALAGVGGLATQTASAQQGGLEEIVVTATRRAEDLQEVPISIVAVTGEGLQMRGLQNVENLNATIPNLSVMGQAGGLGTSGTSFRVRGIPNVGTYVDGVWQISTNGFLTEEFVDLDRIEVLRGPQGTLFGRDSVGGAIRIFTKAPTDEFGGTFKGTLGTLNRHDATITANLPFSDKVKSKWTFADLNRDGYITSLQTGRKGGDIDQSTWRGDILWTPTDKLDIRSQFSRQESKYIEPRVEDAVWISSGFNPTATAALLYTNAGLPYDQNSQMAGWPGGTVGKWENRSEITLPNQITTDQASFDVKLALTDKLSIDFLTGYTNQRADIFVDYDNSQYVVVEDTSNQRNKLFSQEIQISGGGDKVQWVAGAFYWDESRRTRGVRYAMQEFSTDPITMADNALALALYATPYCQNLVALAATNSLPPGGTTCQAGMAQYKTNSTVARFGGIGGTLTENGTSGIALFGEVTLPLTEKFTLTVGAREHDQDNYSQTMTPTGAAPRYANQEFAADPLAGYLSATQITARDVSLNSFSKATSRLSAKYQFTKNVMGYASFSQGFNSGNATYVTNPETGVAKLYPTKPETLNNFEVGVRSDLADGKVRFNATLFDTKWDDIVINTALRICDPNCRDLTAVYPQNVGSAHAKGAELELTLVPTSKLLFNINLGFLDTGYDKITVPSVVQYVPGKTEFSQAPDKTINIGIQYDAGLKSGASLTTRFDYTYVSQYWRSADPTLRVAYYPGIPAGYSGESGDIGTYNARLTYAPANGKWDWAVFGTNLTNEYQLNSGFFHGVWGYDFATVARPRELGTSFTFHF
ncbi:MAG TPA: TonB-dependent receptor [Gammaproteobacteria bacterium]|jgi:iron complex outermembrane receptor protein|nr:TonB-dependent receptor [Gammaproteobacteria bacterium]